MGQKPGSHSGSVFIAWAPHCPRTAALAASLGLQPLWIHNFRFRQPRWAPFKYPLQIARTLVSLWRGRPSIVFVQNPPIFAVACVWLYSVVTGTPYVIDSHSGAFEAGKWKWTLPLHAALSRRALTTLVTNPALLDVVRGWSANGMVMHDLAMSFAAMERRSSRKRLEFIVPCGFGKDEMLDTIVSAAAGMTEVDFVFTGDVEAYAPRLLTHRPKNVRFTGWLSEQQYAEALMSADAVLTLTTRENTLLRGAWEAMYAGKPLITSDRACLRHYFTRGAVFVADTVGSVVSGVKRACALRSSLEAEMVSLRAQETNRSDRQLEQLRCLCEEKALPNRVATARGRPGEPRQDP
jgi:hypothetical protein